VSEENKRKNFESLKAEIICLILAGFNCDHQSVQEM
jgi:hypothetical protein